MALSKFHILATGLGLHRAGNYGNLEAFIPWVVLPDAIRCFKFGDNIPNNRVVSHFERNPHTGKASWMVFPSIKAIKTLTDEDVQQLPMHVEPDYKQVAIGDETILKEFAEHNSNCCKDSDLYNGIYLHLMQDRLYDAYIRKVIDCSRRSEGIFTFGGNTYDAKSVRKLITEIEEQEFRILVAKFESETGIRPDMAWFEQFVKSSFESAYCPKMAETTWKYISVDLDSEIPQHLDDLTDCEAMIETMIDNIVRFFK